MAMSDSATHTSTDPLDDVPGAFVKKVWAWALYSRSA